MKIGILAPDLNSHHGWGSYSLSLLRALHRAGIPMQIVCAHDSPPLPDLPTEPLLPSVSPLGRAFFLKQMLALPRARAALRACTHLHALVEPYALLGAWLAGERPLLMTAHGTYAQMPARRFPTGALYRRAFLRARIIAVSQHTAALVREIVPGADATVIPNAVDAARYLALERQPAPAPTILFVGGIKARKGVLELVDAFALIRERLPDARLLLVGALTPEPAYAEAVRQRIAAHRLGDAVLLAGRLDDADLLPLYSQAWAFALPAQTVNHAFEGFGLALLEASAAGLPVISTRGSGTEDAVRDGETGLLVAQDDRAALADALIRVLTDRTLAARLGMNGRAYAAGQTWDAVAARVIALYEQQR